MPTDPIEEQVMNADNSGQHAEEHREWIASNGACALCTRLVGEDYLKANRALGQRVAELEAGLIFIAQQGCEATSPSATEDRNCEDTQDCITEWCLPCYASAYLRAHEEPTHD